MLRPILVCMFVGLPWVAAATDRPAPAADAPEKELIDEAREEVRDAVEWLAREVDSWFGGRTKGSTG
jgi:hypothetical protein